MGEEKKARVKRPSFRVSVGHTIGTTIGRDHTSFCVVTKIKFVPGSSLEECDSVSRDYYRARSAMRSVLDIGEIGSQSAWWFDSIAPYGPFMMRAGAEMFDIVLIYPNPAGRIKTFDDAMMSIRQGLRATLPIYRTAGYGITLDIEKITQLDLPGVDGVVVPPVVEEKESPTVEPAPVVAPDSTQPPQAPWVPEPKEIVDVAPVGEYSGAESMLHSKNSPMISRLGDPPVYVSPKSATERFVEAVAEKVDDQDEELSI